MATIRQYINRQNIAFLAGLTLILGLLFSRGMMSVAMMILLGLALFQRDWKQTFVNFSRSKSLLWIALMFGLIALSGLYTKVENLDFYADKLINKLPFIALPLAFAGLPRLNKQQVYFLLYAFFWLVAGSAVAVTIHYITHYDIIVSGYSYGKVMPTPVNHIRYSLMVAFAVLIGLYLLSKQYFLVSRKERAAQVLIIIFLITFIHILSVRSGMVAIYASLACMLIYALTRTKRKVLAVSGLLLVLSLPIFAYAVVPTFQQKIHYASRDIQAFVKGEYRNGWSDGGRIVSWQAAIKATKRSPIIGLGMGDMKAEINEVYESDYPEIFPEIRHMPHNQFVYYYAALGLIGLALGTISFFYPLWHKQRWRNILFLSFHVMVFFSMLVEATFETQLGVAFYIYFLLLLLFYVDIPEGEEKGSLFVSATTRSAILS